MNRKQISQYVAKYARYSPTAPPKFAYHCNFPTPHATQVFYSRDTHDLAEQIAEYCKKPGSKEVSDRAVELLK